MTETTSEEASSSENNLTSSERPIPILRQPNEPVDSHASSIPPPVVNLSNLNIGARTMERSRLLVNNISTTIEEIQPFIEQARLVI